MTPMSARPHLFELMRQETLADLAQLDARVNGPARLTPDAEADFLRRAKASWRGRA